MYNPFYPNNMKKKKKKKYLHVLFKYFLAAQIWPNDNFAKLRPSFSSSWIVLALFSFLKPTIPGTADSKPA